MKNQVIFIAGVALVSSAALADVANVRSMQDGQQIDITATVDRVQNEREFTLRDSSGTINVDIESNESVVLKPGDTVDVSGILDKGWFGADINASQVIVHKGVAQAMGDAIEGRTNLSLEGATSYNIRNLPKEGLVKVTGTVTAVKNEKEFTVKDTTGSIKVDVESSETAALTKGAEVTVVGYVDRGVLGTRDINAHKVLVLSNASPMANAR